MPDRSRGYCPGPEAGIPGSHSPGGESPRLPARDRLALHRIRTPGAGRWESSPTSSTSAHRLLQAGAPPWPESDSPDEVDDVARHRVRLLELQKVPRVLDDEHVSAWQQNPFDPRDV